MVRTHPFRFGAFFFLATLSVGLCARGDDSKLLVKAQDRENDGGGGIVVEWKPWSPPPGARELLVWRFAADSGEEERCRVAKLPPEETSVTDLGSDDCPLEDGVPYVYVVQLIEDGDVFASSTSEPVTARPNWFDSDRTVNCAAVILFVSAFLVFYLRARRGERIELRHIDGIESFRPAVGRAAEMGKPVLYVPGLQSIGNPATIASMSILSSVAEAAARLKTPVRVPNYDPLTWPVAQSVVEEAHVRAGRREEFDPQSVMYISARYLAYATAVAAMMVRDKTATHFFVGHFYSESLILAETGAATGAKQIAASDSETQLPFLITTCDHTLIGEELFAAAAILDEAPVQRVTIRVHDWFKALAVAAMLAGLALAAASSLGLESAGTWLEQLRAFLTEGRG